MAPSICALYNAGYIQAIAVPQLATFQAAIQFIRTEGIVPAPESAHAIRVAIDEAIEAKINGDSRIILFNLSGHGDYDMSAYQAYLSGQLDDYEYPEDAIRRSLEHLPKVHVAE
jgi:predicted alternative tryptophan synthase beta-subunit